MALNLSASLSFELEIDERLAVCWLRYIFFFYLLLLNFDLQSTKHQMYISLTRSRERWLLFCGGYTHQSRNGAKSTRFFSVSIHFVKSSYMTHICIGVYDYFIIHLISFYYFINVFLCLILPEANSPPSAEPCTRRPASTLPPNSCVAGAAPNARCARSVTRSPC